MEKDPPIIIQNCNLNNQKDKFIKPAPTPKNVAQVVVIDSSSKKKAQTKLTLNLNKAIVMPTTYMNETNKNEQGMTFMNFGNIPMNKGNK